jgi:hypothetical protein
VDRRRRARGSNEGHAIETVTWPETSCWRLAPSRPGPPVKSHETPANHTGLAAHASRCVHVSSSSSSGRGRPAPGPIRQDRPPQDDGRDVAGRQAESRGHRLEAQPGRRQGEHLVPHLAETVRQPRVRDDPWSPRSRLLDEKYYYISMCVPARPFLSCSPGPGRSSGLLT